MFGFDKMFDFNRDGKLDSWERAAQFQFMDEMMKNNEKNIFDDDDKSDIFADAGLDYDELDAQIFYPKENICLLLALYVLKYSHG